MVLSNTTGLKTFISPIDGDLTIASIPGQSEAGSNDNEMVLP